MRLYWIEGASLHWNEAKKKNIIASPQKERDSRNKISDQVKKTKRDKERRKTKKKRKRKQRESRKEIKRQEPQSIAIIRLSFHCPRYCLALFIDPQCIVLRKGLSAIRPSSLQSYRARGSGATRCTEAAFTIIVFQFPARSDSFT